MRTSSSPRLRAVLLLVLVLAGCVAVWIRFRGNPPRPSAPTTADLGVREDWVAQLAALQARESNVARTVWAQELQAQQCGRVFEALWDDLNAASNKLAALDAFPVNELVLARWSSRQTLAHGVEVWQPADDGPRLSGNEWRQLMARYARAGWDLVQTEFRHVRFDPGEAERPPQSRFYFCAHLTHPPQTNRAVLQGDLIVDWAPTRTPDALPTVARIDAHQLTLKTRQGEPPFRLLFSATLQPPEQSFFIDPLILYDLDGDGASEICLAARNLVWRRGSDGSFQRAALCRHSPGLIFTAVIADLDGDAAADFLCAKFEGLVLFKGSPLGRFDEPGRLVWAAQPHLKYGQVLTAGDIDRDGDLDVWLGQYKGPYVRGQMPTPYYDANDGNPAYLLLNDGKGGFTDATVASGLSAKRWRRAYSGSFADLDDDGDLDLLVASDFAGVALYANDGRGRFREVTTEWLAEAHGFGMAHTLADFNADGRLDFLVMGMHCPAALRLDHLHLQRPDFPDYAEMRPRMTSGNRLALARPDSGFEQTSLNASIAHSGWSWGCTAADFDNDGFPDVYVANGHESKQSVRDYEPEFWLHDIYVGASRNSIVTNAYFLGKHERTRGRGWSYGGYEKNRLYLNQQGQSFLEAGHLMGVALEEDSRNVVADDLDADGRLDLLVTTFEVWPEARQTLRVFRNTFPEVGNWIGFRLREQGNGSSPVGARILIRTREGQSVRQLVTGDSHRSQHANTLHFGLGEATSVARAEIRWANGGSLVLRAPAVNRYHEVLLPGGE